MSRGRRERGWVVGGLIVGALAACGGENHSPDAGPPDAAADASANDTGIADAAVDDAGLIDAGTLDAGPLVPATGTWHSLGLLGGAVERLAVVPRIGRIPRVYAAVIGGVFVSDDGGATWSRSGFENEWVKEIVYVPEHVPPRLIATLQLTEPGIFTSDDEGRTWLPATATYGGVPGDAPRSVQHVVLDARTPGTLYAGANYFPNCIFISHDYGSTWADTSTAPDLGYPGAMVSSPSGSLVLVAGSTGDALPSPLYGSTDGALGWAVRGAALPGMPEIRALVRDPASPTAYYALTAAGAYHSPDSALSWTALPAVAAGLGAYSMAFDPSAPSALRLGGTGIYASTDGAARLDGPYLRWEQFADMANVGGAFLAAGYYGGVYRETAPGTWLGPQTGFDARDVRDVWVDPSDELHLVAASWNGVWTTMDGGMSWTVGAGVEDAPVRTVRADPHAAGTFYASAQNGLWRSVDSARTWTHVADIPGYVYEAVPSPTDPMLVVAAAGRVWVSTDAGIHFSPTIYPGTEATSIAFVQRAGAEVVLVGDFFDGILASVDAGARFAPAGIAGRGVSALAASETGPDGRAVAATDVGLFGSADGGRSWSGAGLSGTMSTATISPDGRVVFAARSSLLGTGGIFRAVDDLPYVDISGTGLGPVGHLGEVRGIATLPSDRTRAVIGVSSMGVLEFGP